MFAKQVADAVQYHATIHGYLTNYLPNVDSIQILFQGQVVHAEAWTFATGGRVIDFEVSTAELANVVRNVGSRETAQVQILFRDGGVTIARSAIREIPVVDPPVTLINIANEAAYNALTTKPTNTFWYIRE